MKAGDGNPRRGIYLLPNLFTTAALFAGFYAIVQAMDGHFEVAAMGVFVAMVFDGLDGRIARMTQTQSRFGAEYDSLADMISFGAAPALIVYEWTLRDLGKLGWAAAFLYCATAALRLARFNVAQATADKRFFQGLPSPAAAALLAGLVWVGSDSGLISGRLLTFGTLALTLGAGLAMVSKVLYWSGKSINLKAKVPFIVGFAIVLALALVSSYPPGVLFVLFLGYAASGPIYWCVRKLRRRGRPAASGGVLIEEEKNP